MIYFSFTLSFHFTLSYIFTFFFDCQYLFSVIMTMICFYQAVFIIPPLFLGIYFKITVMQIKFILSIEHLFSTFLFACLVLTYSQLMTNFLMNDNQPLMFDYTNKRVIHFATSCPMLFME